MGDLSPPKSLSVRSNQPSIERQSIHNQSPTVPRPLRLSTSVVSNKSLPVNAPPIALRYSPIRKLSPEKIQVPSGQRSPSVKPSVSPLQQKNSARISTSNRTGEPAKQISPIRSKLSTPNRIQGPVEQRNSVSARVSPPVKIPSPTRQSNAGSARLSTSNRIPSAIEQRNSVTARDTPAVRTPSPTRQSNTGSVRLSTSNRIPSTARVSTPGSPPKQGNSVSARVSIPDNPTEQRNSVIIRVPSPNRIASPIKERNSLVEIVSTPDRSGSPTEQRNSVSIRTSPGQRSSYMNQGQPGSGSILKEVVNLEPQGKTISEHMDELNETVKKLSESMENSQPTAGSNIEKIANMSQILTNEANALRNSIKSLSEDIAQTKQDLRLKCKEDDDLIEVPDCPHHLFLLELIVNRIQMKCECFEMDDKNLVITAKFLGKAPVVLYDNSCGNIDDFNKLNVGMSILSAMTYERICQVQRFQVLIEISKQPPCSHCVTKIGETVMEYSNEFMELRQDLCDRWQKERPRDDIVCTASTPMMRNQYYISCGECDPLDLNEAIGLIEMSVRMSFLGKEITTALGPKKEATSVLLKENNGITMYSCQKVEMDDAGKVLLDEGLMNRREPRQREYIPPSRTESPLSYSSITPYLSTKRFAPKQGQDQRYDEICTRMNDNELKIRVPKSTRVERNPRYERIAELCSCEDTPYNTGEQIQFELPTDYHYPDKSHKNHSSNLKYTYNGCDRTCESKDRKVLNVTPANCPLPIDIGKVAHPQRDVFILKIGKKLETKDRKTDLEIELVTPKCPEICPANVSQQCSKTEVKPKKKGKGKGKVKTKKGKKGKKGKRVGQ